jgi:hypothetical protein
LSPSANAPLPGGDDNGFEVNPTNAYANDGLVAADNNSGTNNSSNCTSNGKDKHSFYNYTVSIPGTSIDGIEVRLDALVDATSGAPKMCVQLSGDGGLTWTSVKSTPTLTPAEATYILGGAADIWGQSWTPVSLSNANFRLRVIDAAGNTSRDFFLDWVAVRVTYH